MVWTFCRNLFNVLYPPFCLHCDLSLDQKKTFFCQACLELLTPIKTEERCRTCFGAEVPCLLCMQRPAFLKRAAAACDPFSPAVTLSSHLYKGHTLFVPAAASLMVLQFLALDWPLPDLIVPAPLSLWTRSKRGGDTHTLLAKQIGSTLNTPCAKPLKAAWDKRCFLERADWKTRVILRGGKKTVLPDMRILLVTLKLEDTALRQAAEALLEGGASEIYALALL